LTPDPLHPAVVHLPIALALLLPGLAVLGILCIHYKVLPQRIWSAVVLLQVLLAASAWLAVETGEEEHEKAERVVARDLIEEHEEAGERVLLVAALALVPVGLGLLAGRPGAIGRLVHVAFSLFLLATAISAGRLGGELVYVHGAASAYVEQQPAMFEESELESGEHSH
jgi:uncharacterized membrane protein